MKKITFFILLLSLLQACNQDPETPAYLTVEGKTMGTYYRVTYRDTVDRDFSKEIDSLLVKINSEINTYEPNSTISQFNKTDSVYELGLSFKDYADCLSYPQTCGKVKNRHFYANFLVAKVAHERTRHNFDPTIMPLVNYWGFGYTPHKAVTQVDSARVDSLLQFIGFEKVKLIDRNGFAVLTKTLPQVQIDFGGTGQGYGIDAVSDYLEWKGISDYLVDIGGESRARGKNPRGKWWTIGINTPKSEASTTDFTRVIELRNMSVSTSGNYRNFYEVDGQKYSHFISPVTGFPEKNTLLSASLFGKDCLLPDALATGLMVMGVDEAYTLASQLEGIDALFIYSDEAGELQVKYTTGVEDILIQMEE